MSSATFEDKVQQPNQHSALHAKTAGNDYTLKNLMPLHWAKPLSDGETGENPNSI